MKTTTTDTAWRNKSIVRAVLATVLMLLIPLVAMQFTDKVNWELEDFVVGGALILGTGFIYAFVGSRLRNAAHRAILGVVLIAAMSLIWIELAVGIFG